VDFAYKYFLKTAKIDLEAKYKVYVGTVFMGGSHPAANGGAWMTAIFGFGGVRADGNRLVINPRLCRKWKQLKFHLSYQGDDFQIGITKSSVTIAASADNKRDHTLVVASRSVKCRAGKVCTVGYPAKR